mmetsp:Transcript_35732/g.49606  ORF Transcript_35732/g.49606 Transcript_35732/m.49606 type:complete len:83 (+) Transcript_35732:89-337(+)
MKRSVFLFVVDNIKVKCNHSWRMYVEMMIAEGETVWNHQMVGSAVCSFVVEEAAVASVQGWSSCNRCLSIGWEADLNEQVDC